MTQFIWNQFGAFLIGVGVGFWMKDKCKKEVKE